MPGIDGRVWDLGVVGVHAAQHDAEAPVPQEIPHPVVEEARPRAEVVVGQDGALGLVRVDQLRLDHADLVLELVIVQRGRRLVPHGVVSELVPAPHEFAERLLPALDLRADHEEGRVRVVLAQYLHDLVRVVGGRIVDGQGDDLLGGADLEEHVWVFAAQVADEIVRRLVDAPCGVEGEYE